MENKMAVECLCQEKLVVDGIRNVFRKHTKLCPDYLQKNHKVPEYACKNAYI